MRDVSGYYGDAALVFSSPRELEASGERVDLIRGLAQRIISYETIDDRHKTEWFNTPASGAMLTDGVYAALPECHDPAWFHFTGGEARAIFYDLGALCAVDGFSIGILR